MPKDSADDSLDGMSKEVDRLLKKLPGADPYLRGSGEPAPPPKTGLAPTPSTVRAPGQHLGEFSQAEAPGASRKLGVWLRVLLGVALGVLMSQWPYAHACGILLYLYLAAVVAVIVAGGWASVSSWKLRMGIAHVVSLLLVLWGLILAADQVLPRAGYATRAATWQCP
jgi:hypothetical protein